MEGASSLRSLVQEVRNRGWYEKPTGRAILELSSHVLLTAFGIAVFVISDVLWVRVLAMAVSTVGTMGVLTLTHTASHYAAAGPKWLNELMLYFGYTFFWGVSAHYWWYKHVTVHHPAPNVVGVDADADFMPWVALTQRDVAESRGFRRWYYQNLQPWVFPFLLLGLGFSMQLSSWTHLLKALRDPEKRRPKMWIDLSVLVLHLVAWLGLPMLFFAPLDVVGFHALRVSLAGYVVFAVSAPGHLPAYAACIGPDDESTDFLLRQTATTANFSTGPVGRWLLSGLQYQIEHHLFPTVNHVYYPRLSLLVQEHCRRRGVPYHCSTWDQAMWRTFKVLAAPKHVEGRLEDLRLPPTTSEAS
jgi:linoleoyl-CoA desaturase